MSLVAAVPMQHRLPGSSNGTQGAELEHEAPARLVVATVGPEEARVRVQELLRPVARERPALLVPRPQAALLGEPGGQGGVAREPLGVAAHAGAEVLGGGAEGGVEEPDVDR